MLEEARTSAGLHPTLVVGWDFSGERRCFCATLLHPGQVRVLCLAAPGRVTAVDPDLDWWQGTRNTRELFGAAVNVAAFTSLPVQVLVGDADRDPLPTLPSEPGRSITRRQRLERFVQHLRGQGSDARLLVVPDVAHTLAPLAHAGKLFLRRQLLTTD